MIALYHIMYCFIAALITTLALRLYLGQRCNLYFKKSAPKSVITLRGSVGYHLALGYPKNIKGFLITSLLVLAHELHP